MTSRRDGEILTRVGPGTAMGEMMRQYWLPGLKASELEADGDPVRFQLLGEKLIAFRDSSGRVGVMDHRCPHRCASLFFGRNEEGGIRCVYHGWKFDVDGNCLEMANVPPAQDFKQKVKAKAYKAAERNGLVWVFMGAPDNVPALPDIDPTLIPEDELTIRFVQRECNWLQAMEGDIDTSHLGFLHLGAVGRTEYQEGDVDHNVVSARAPEFLVKDTEFGVTYAAHRAAAETDQRYWRFAHFLFPCWALPPISPFHANRIARAWVPMDDTHTMFISIAHKDALVARRASTNITGGTLGDRLRPNTTDWFGRWRLEDHFGNDFGIERDVQRNESFTGIDGIHLQDQAITESMGKITDHGFEHLAPSDLMIAQTRKRLLGAAKAYQKDGTKPPGANDGSVFAGVRGGSFNAANDLAWNDAYELQIRAHVAAAAE